MGIKKTVMCAVLGIMLGTSAISMYPAKAYAATGAAASWEDELVTYIRKFSGSRATVNTGNAAGSAINAGVKIGESVQYANEYTKLIDDYVENELKKDGGDAITADPNGSELLQKNGIKTAFTVKGLKNHLYEMNTGSDTSGKEKWWDVADKGRAYTISVIKMESGNDNKKKNNKPDYVITERKCYILRLGKNEYYGEPAYIEQLPKMPGITDQSRKFTSLATCISRLTPTWAWKGEQAAKDAYTTRHLPSLHKFTSDTGYHSTSEYVKNGSADKRDRTSLYLAENPNLEKVHKNKNSSDDDSILNGKDFSILNGKDFTSEDQIGTPDNLKKFDTLPSGTKGLLTSNEVYNSKYCVHIFTNCESNYYCYADLFPIDGIYSLINHTSTTADNIKIKKSNGKITVKTPGQTKWAKDIAEAFKSGAKAYFMGSDRVEVEYGKKEARSAIEFGYSSNYEYYFYHNLKPVPAYDYVNGRSFANVLGETASEAGTFSNNFGTVLPLFTGSDYAVALFKTDSSQNGKLLQGAKFKFSWTTAPLSSEKDYLNDKLWLTEKNKKSDEFETDKKGHILVKGIANTIAENDDNLLIRIQETKAPEGYQEINKDNQAQYTVVIKAKTGEIVYGEGNVLGARKTEMKDKKDFPTGGVLYSLIFDNSANKGRINIKKVELEKDGTTKKPLDDATFEIYADKDGKPDTENKLATVTTGKETKEDDKDSKKDSKNKETVKHGESVIYLPAFEEGDDKGKDKDKDKEKKPKTYWVKETAAPTGYTTAVTKDGSEYFKIQFTDKTEEQKNAEYEKDGYDQTSVMKEEGKGKDKKQSYEAEITIYDEKAKGIVVELDKVDSKTGKKLKGAGFRVLRYVAKDPETGAKLSTPLLLNKKKETKQNVTGDVFKNAKSYYTIVTDENGHGIIGEKDELPAGMYSKKGHKWIPFIYKIKETQTPYTGSYKLDDTVYVVTSDKSYHAGEKEKLKTFTYDKTKAEAVKVDLGEIKNEPEKFYGDLKIIKIDAESNEDGSEYYIEGAGFTLYKQKAGSETKETVGEKKTGADGVIEWKNLPLTEDDGTWNVYSYKETIVPEYKRKNPDGSERTADDGTPLKYQPDDAEITITSDMWMAEKDKNPDASPIKMEKKVVNATQDPPKQEEPEEPPEIDPYIITKNPVPYPFENPDNNPSNPSDPNGPKNPNDYHGNTKEVNPDTGDINSAPTAYTYNNNAIYDLGTAIPTTESFTNTFEGNTWYGSVSMNRHQLTNTISVNASTAGIIVKPLMKITLKKYKYKYDTSREYYNTNAEKWYSDNWSKISAGLEGMEKPKEGGIDPVYSISYATESITSALNRYGYDYINTPYAPLGTTYAPPLDPKTKQPKETVQQVAAKMKLYWSFKRALYPMTYNAQTHMYEVKAGATNYARDMYGNALVPLSDGSTYVYAASNGGSVSGGTYMPGEVKHKFDVGSEILWNDSFQITKDEFGKGVTANIKPLHSDGPAQQYMAYANDKAGSGEQQDGILTWENRTDLKSTEVEQDGNDNTFEDGIIEDGKTKDEKTDVEDDKKSKYGNDVWDNVKFKESASPKNIEKVYDKTLSGTFTYNDGGSTEVGKSGSSLGGGKHKYETLALEDGKKDDIKDRAHSDMDSLDTKKRYNLRSYSAEYDEKTAKDAMIYKNYQQTVANKEGGYEGLNKWNTNIKWVKKGESEGINPPILKADDKSGYSKTSTGHWMYDFPYFFHLRKGKIDEYIQKASDILKPAYDGIHKRYYYEVADITLKQLEDATVKNYSGPEVNYQNNIEIPYDIKTLKTGNRVTTGSMLTDADFTSFEEAKGQKEPDKNHYIQDPVPKRVIKQKVGDKFEGDTKFDDFSDAALKAMAKMFVNVVDGKRVVPLSDTVILNNVKYCDEKMGVPSKSICGTGNGGTVASRDGYNVIDDAQESEDNFYIKGIEEGSDYDEKAAATELFHKNIAKDTDIKGDNRIYPFTDKKNEVGAKLIGKQDNDWFSDSKDITIPMETRNGRYGTDMTVNYKPIAYKSGSVSFGFTANDGGEAIAHENEGIDGWNDKAIKPGGSTEVGDFSGGSDNYDIVSDSDPDTVAERAAGNRWKAHEPVDVHSPVVSPIHLEDPSKTQSLNIDSAITGQLLPDHEYTMDFDWDRIYDGAGYHRMAKQYAGYTFPKGYLKFVRRKQIRFPFDVRIQGLEDNKPEYYKTGSDGYTKWITLGTDNWTKFKFYVPTWADTGVYDATASEDLTGSPAYHAKSIQSRVWANNSLLKLLDEQLGRRNGNAQENETDLPFSIDEIVSEEYNTDRQYYVTTFNYPVQINSIMYGFTVLGINDEDSYNKSGLDKWENDDWHQLAKYKQEKSTGKYNRVGGTAKRYEQGEEVTNDWPDSQTLPFSQGKADYALNGLMSCGQIFSFKLNTINGGIGADSTGYARNGADKSLLNDYVVIKPSFRYVSKYGEIYDEDDIMLSCDAKGNHYIDLDDELVTDTGATRSLTDIYFEGAICSFPYNDDCSYGSKDNINCGKYTNDVKQTTVITNYLPQAEKRTVQDIQNSRVPVHMSTHEFTITPDNMLFHGDEAELESELTKNGTDVDRYGKLFTTAKSGNDRLYDLLDYDQKEAFMSSMQRWYGLYAIPNSIHVRVSRRTTDPEYNMYKDKDGKSFDDVTEYPWEPMASMLTTTGKTMTSDELHDFFVNSGYLVLNFKITEYHNGQPEISYYECPSNMWDIEQNGDYNDPDNPNNPGDDEPHKPNVTIKQTHSENDPENPNKPIPDTVNIPTKDGDIAIIDLTQHKNSNGNHSDGEGQFSTDLLWVE